MSVVTMKKEDRAVSGSGMDKVVEKKGLSQRVKMMIGGGAAAIALVGFFMLAPTGDSQTVDASRITVSTVSKGVFEDFLPLRGRVTPSLTIFLDAIEGGRVEQLLVEDGANVQKGQLLAIMSNAQLQLDVLSREAQVTEQLNIMRGQELALERNRLESRRNLVEADYQLSRLKRQLDRDGALVEKGWVPRKTFNDTKDEYGYHASRKDVLLESQRTDERLQATQLSQLRASATTLQKNLDVARTNLDSLNLRAPVTGQLSGFTLQVGQSMARGERLGQIDSPGRNKLVAGVDEFYLGRVQVGQKASVDVGGKSYALKVVKIYPTVRNGEFEVDLAFTGDEPTGIQRGQTIQTRLTLGDPTPATLIPAGSFYNDTGGNWVFVVSPGGGSAEKRNVRLGRRNSQFIEVLDGLETGEKVVTSPYTGLTDKDQLDIESSD
ncbi:efflux RND transporter periplasmic adaptor subunit [Sphingoaurantiacus capsulatus]|uniref:Efflux RND transporter periplasmic adaptor subunit n=1 Tax=Sphingoaurantiacus capsulatus TaxID=1771310 RepID=A0ABV7X6U9_9SPHN